jgi:hypothetical protein
MSEIWFAIKSMLLTVLIVMLMQFKIGSEKIEDKMNQWVEGSQASVYLHQVAEGATKSIKNMFAFISEKIGLKERREAIGNRLKKLEFSRTNKNEQDQ